jgi:hypothetical protein
LKRIPRRTWSQEAGQRRLAHLERLSSEILAVELEEIEGVHEDETARWLLAETLEHGQAVVVASYRFAVD